MTGFGKGSAESKALRLDVEMKTVNNRFLDFSIRLPRGYGQFEMPIRELVSGVLRRGRVEVNVVRTVKLLGDADIFFDEPLFRAYKKKYEKAFGMKEKDFPPQVVCDILSRREVLHAADDDSISAAEEKLLLQAVEDALQNLLLMRGKEGAALAKDFDGRLEHLGVLRKQIEQKAAKSASSEYDRLTQRLKKILADATLDENRLAQEAALIADRIDITEELVRLQSHLDQARKTLAEGKEAGKRMEFILQEMGREVNTIGSKTQEAAVQTLVIDAKTTLERMREQAANLE